MMHLLRKYDVAPLRSAMMRCLPQCAVRHTSLGEAVIIGGANIICRRQTSFKKRTFVGRQKCVFCCLKRVKRSKIEVKTKKRSTFSCCLLDKLEFDCLSQCFHKQIFLIAIRNIGKNANHFIPVLLIKFGSLPTHCIKMNVMATSANSFFFSFTQEL